MSPYKLLASIAAAGAAVLISVSASAETMQCWRNCLGGWCCY